jgi:hypothetical protein
MTYVSTVAVSAALLFGLNVRPVFSAPLPEPGSPANLDEQQAPAPQGPTWTPSPAAPNAATAPANTPAPPNQPVALPVKDEDSRLSPEARIELIRYVSGEFARANFSLPAKKGFRVRVGEPISRQDLLESLQDNGISVNAGDNVQITKLEFGGSDITVEVNGGGGASQPWWRRIQIQGGAGGMPVSTQSTVKDYGAPPDAPPGTVVHMDFGRPLPEMTPDELKQYLSVVFDFSNQRSAAVQWTESLPPEIREAIAEKRAIVSMDQDQVLAALGRPERKVRERQLDGTETEDWIYGQPPGKTIFVRFTGDKVVRVSQYPQ